MTKRLPFAVGIPMPRGFERVTVGHYEVVARKIDGADLNALHRADTCPKDCPLCILRARRSSPWEAK